MDRFAVVICGGGIAATEALLRLRRLAGDHVDVTLLCPNDELVYRPLAVGEPFANDGVRRYPIAQISGDTDARWMQASLGWVDRVGHKVHTAGDEELAYDALLLAVGARETPPFRYGTVFTDVNADETFHGIVQDVETGYVADIAFVLPDGPIRPLPLYELALMTAERAYSMDVRVRLTLVTPEQRPLQAFGTGAAEAVTRLLQDAGITLYTGCTARVDGPRRVIVGSAGIELHPQRIITLPKLSGPSVRGIAGGGAHGFLPVDPHCRVRGTDGRIFAAGDATDLPVKHGGIGAQQADTAAAGIAHLAGVADVPPPINPMIRGKLLTGRRPVYMAAHLVAGRGWTSEIYEQPPWPEDEKIVAEELGPYLRSLEPVAAQRT